MASPNTIKRNQEMAMLKRTPIIASDKSGNPLAFRNGEPTIIMKGAKMKILTRYEKKNLRKQ